MYMQYNVINYTITLIAMYACKFITHRDLLRPIGLKPRFNVMEAF